MKVPLLVCCIVLFAACGKGLEKQAAQRLELAQDAYLCGDYAQAKLHIDSIKILYPKAFKARRAGQQLMLDVELSAQQIALDSLDNALAVQQEAFGAIKNKFVLEKDAQYQQIGNYLWPAQTIENNINRSYLRFQVNELGVMSMTSIYCGTYNIHHVSVKVTAPDGTFAQSPASKDSYETTNMDMRIEKADYKKGDDGGVIDFVAANQGKNIRLTYLGDKTFNTSLTASDRKAAAAVNELAQVLSCMEQIKKEKERVSLKIGFINKKKEVQAQRAAQDSINAVK